MEVLGFMEVPAWVVAIAPVIFSVCLYSWYKQSYFSRLGIRTKRTLFLIGDLPQVIMKGMEYIDANVVEKEGKVFGSFIGNTPSLIVNDADMLKQILVKNFANFTDRVSVPVEEEFDSAVSLSRGSHWKFLRSTLSPTFSSGKLRNMAPLINRCIINLNRNIDKQIKHFPDGFDMYIIFRGHTLDVILATGFGMEVNAIENPDNDFVKNAQTILDFDPSKSFIFLLRAFFPDMPFGRVQLLPKGLMAYMKKALTKAFIERKKDSSPHNDLLQLMLNAHKDSTKKEEDENGIQEKISETIKRRGLTDDEVFINALIFMGAGFDTTAVTLSWIVYYLALYPACQEKLVEEIDAQIGQSEPNYNNVFKLQYLDMVINETLRCSSIVPRLNRQAKEDIVINNVPIKKGMDVTFTPLALHFSTEYWEEPNKFDPERFSPENKHKQHEYAFMPFGMGPRNCVGMRLALFEVKATIVGLLQRFRFEKTDGLAVPMPTMTRSVRGPARPIHLKVTKRK